jgi:hypothetical protein
VQVFLSEDSAGSRRFATLGTYTTDGLTLTARVTQPARVTAGAVAPVAGTWEIDSINTAPRGARIVATVQSNGTQVLLQADTDGNGTLDSSQLVASATLFN